MRSADNLLLGQPTSQPHQQILHSVPGNSHGDSTPIVPQHDIACDGDSTMGLRDDGLDAGIFPTPILPPLDQGIAQGNIQRYEILEWY